MVNAEVPWYASRGGLYGRDNKDKRGSTSTITRTHSSAQPGFSRAKDDRDTEEEEEEGAIQGLGQLRDYSKLGVEVLFIDYNIDKKAALPERSYSTQPRKPSLGTHMFITTKHQQAFQIDIDTDRH